MTTHRIAQLAPSLLAAAVAAGCVSSEADQAAPPPPPAVTTSEVAVREVADWADFTGRLEAAETVEVRPRVGGYVQSVHFEEGGRVAAGDLLFQIDPRPFRAEVDRLSAEVERARAEVEVARSNSERAERLLAQNATSREEFERLKADADVAEAALAAVEAALEAAELDLSFTRVTAPIAGRVSRAVVTAGNLVDGSTLLTTVVSDDPIYAYFDADEHTYLELIRGAEGAASNPYGPVGAGGSDEGASSERDAARSSESDGAKRQRPRRSAHEGPLREDARAVAFVGLVNEEGYPHVARLDFVDNRVDPAQGTIRARAVLDNPDGRLTPGLFARIRVVGGDTYRAALVAQRAVGTDLDRKYVLVVDESNVAQYRPVELGRVLGDLRIVTEGLAAGDEVIVNGLQRVRPGMPVAPTEVAMEVDVPMLERFAAIGRADEPSAAADETAARAPGAEAPEPIAGAASIEGDIADVIERTVASTKRF